ncbi:hypothetical protein D3C86_1046990 [compost metagenome]
MLQDLAVRKAVACVSDMPEARAIEADLECPRSDKRSCGVDELHGVAARVEQEAIGLIDPPIARGVQVDWHHLPFLPLEVHRGVGQRSVGDLDHGFRWGGAGVGHREAVAGEEERRMVRAIVLDDDPLIPTLLIAVLPEVGSRNGLPLEPNGQIAAGQLPVVLDDLHRRKLCL